MYVCGNWPTRSPRGLGLTVPPTLLARPRRNGPPRQPGRRSDKRAPRTQASACGRFRRTLDRRLAACRSHIKAPAHEVDMTAQIVTLVQER